MPSGLDIDHERTLNGTMPPYAQHVVVRTGRDDWGTKIEDEDESVEGSGMNFAKSLRGLVGRGGKFFDVCICMFAWNLFLCIKILLVHCVTGAEALMQARSI